MSISKIGNRKISFSPKVPKENEKLCDECGGIGWLYVEQDDGSKYIEKCRSCDDGIAHICPNCRKETGRSTVCNNMSCWDKREAENEQRRYEKATKYTLESCPKESCKMFFSDVYGYDNGYFDELDSLEDYPLNDSSVSLYIDKAVQEGYESEIFIDANLKHYPLRDWAGMWNEMKAIVSSYNKIGKRNEKAISHDKLGKHMAHLVRLYMMCIDILEKEEIITYRAEEHDLLMSIRNGEYLDNNRQPTTAFYDLLNEYERRFEYAKQNTSLPDVPDYKKINEFKMYVNERTVRGVV